MEVAIWTGLTVVLNVTFPGKTKVHMENFVFFVAFLKKVKKDLPILNKIQWYNLTTSSVTPHLKTKVCSFSFSTSFHQKNLLLLRIFGNV